MLASVKFSIDTNTPARVRQLSFVSLAIHMNSEYLVCILFITSPQLVPGLVNLQSFFSFMSIGALFPMVIRVVLVIYMGQVQQGRERTCTMLWKIIGLVLSTVGPAIVILALAYFIPILATFIIVLACCSFMFANTLTKLIRGDGKPAFPLYFIFINFVDKTVLLVYLFGMKNAYNIQYSQTWMIVVLVVMFVQLGLYLLQVWLGPRFGLKVKSKHVYDYNQQMTLQGVQEQLAPHRERAAESDVLLSFRAQPGEQNGVCCNPLHVHGHKIPASSLAAVGQAFPQQFGRMLAAMPQGLRNTKNLAECTNCLTYVSQDALEEFCCPICFDTLDVAHH